MAAAQEEERAAEKALNDLLATIPNVPLDDVPVGPDEHANVEARKWGDPRRVNWAKEHFELGEALGQMDFETAAKLSGSRFVVLKRAARAHGAGARPVHARPSHGGARLHGGAAAAVGEGRCAVRDGAAAEVRRRSFWTSSPSASSDFRAIGSSSRDQQRLIKGDRPRDSHDQLQSAESTIASDLDAVRRLLLGARRLKRASGSSPRPKSRSPISCASPSSPRRSFRSASPRSRRASAPRPARPGATRAACCGSISSTRSSSSPSPRRRRASKSMSA